MGRFQGRYGSAGRRLAGALDIIASKLPIFGRNKQASRVDSMPRGQCTFRQADITKAVKAVVAAGVHVARVEVDRAGRIVIIAGEPASADPTKEGEEWDRI